MPNPVSLNVLQNAETFPIFSTAMSVTMVTSRTRQNMPKSAAQFVLMPPTAFSATNLLVFYILRLHAGVPANSWFVSCPKSLETSPANEISVWPNRPSQGRRRGNKRDTPASSCSRYGHNAFLMDSNNICVPCGANMALTPCGVDGVFSTQPQSCCCWLPMQPLVGLCLSSRQRAAQEHQVTYDREKSNCL